MQLIRLRARRKYPVVPGESWLQLKRLKTLIFFCFVVWRLKQSHNHRNSYLYRVPCSLPILQSKMPKSQAPKSRSRTSLMLCYGFVWVNGAFNICITQEWKLFYKTTFRVSYLLADRERKQKQRIRRKVVPFKLLEKINSELNKDTSATAYGSAPRNLSTVAKQKASENLTYKDHTLWMSNSGKKLRYTWITGGNYSECLRRGSRAVCAKVCQRELRGWHGRAVQRFPRHVNHSIIETYNQSRQ